MTNNQEKKNQTEGAPGFKRFTLRGSYSDFKGWLVVKSENLPQVKNHGEEIEVIEIAALEDLRSFYRKGIQDGLDQIIRLSDERDRMKSALEKIYKNTADYETERLAREGLGMK